MKFRSWSISQINENILILASNLMCPPSKQNYQAQRKKKKGKKKHNKISSINKKKKKKKKRQKQNKTISQFWQSIKNPKTK